MPTRMMVVGLSLGLLAAPATSSALGVFLSDDPNGAVRVELPLRVSQNSPPSLNLWMDPNHPQGDGVIGFNMVVTSSGSLTVSFACALGGDCCQCDVGGDPNTVGIAAINTNQAGWDVPFKVGTFDLNADGSVGDELTLDSGEFGLDSDYEGVFTPTVLAVVGGCGDRIEDFGEQCDPPGFDNCTTEPCNPETCLCSTVVPPTKLEQKCVNSINKGAAKVAKAQAGDNASCIKNGGKGKLTGTIEECISSDPKAKVAKAISKIKVGDCPEQPRFPPIDTNATSIGVKMTDRALGLIHAIFGTDLDSEVIVSAAADKPGSKCQAAVAKAVGKCQDAKLAAFNSCKKNKLKGKEPLAPAATSTDELRDVCMGEGPGSIPDPKGKIAKKCVTGLSDALDKKCSVSNLGQLIPGCDPPTATCLDEKVECEVCRALNALDGFQRNCDWFDNGLVDGTCQ